MSRRPSLPATLVLVALGLILPWSGLAPARASLPPADPAATWYTYLPLVARSEPLCPPSSPHSYASGVAYQFDQDDPVRPAAQHADKNLALRGYVPTDPAVRDFVDYGCDDDTEPPQFATLFHPPRVPALTSFHRVHHWIWDQSPNPGQRGDPITDYPVTALGLQTTPGETLVVPVSGYTIGGHPPMEVLVLLADEHAVALRYTREDSSGSPGYTVHIDNICTDPNLLALYNTLDDPGGPRYIYPNPEYLLPTLPAGHPFGVARGTEIVVAISDSGAFQDPRSWDEWWQERPGYPSSTRYPSDIHYTKQWALETIGAPAAWALSTGQHTTIAIIDTGVDLDHPDLTDKVLADAGWDFVNDKPGAHDDHGHGTHVAGIAAAATDNGIGIAGLGWHAEILPLKVLDQRGNGYLWDVAAAIDHAVEARVDVINLSLAPETRMDCPHFLQQAIDAAHAAGIVTVAAAGNSGESIDVPPANCRHVLGVTATRSDDTVASFSSYGDHVSVAAPGSHIFSTWWHPTDPACHYRYMSGTSMATPHVAALAALLIARFPGYSPDQVAAAILDNAVDLGVPGWDEYYGCGRIDAARALRHGTNAAAPLCSAPLTSASQRRAPHPPTDAPFAPGEIIVQLRPGAVAPARWPQQAVSAQSLPSLQAWRLQVPIGQERTVLSHLLAHPDVLHANLNYLVFAQQ